MKIKYTEKEKQFMSNKLKKQLKKKRGKKTKLDEWIDQDG